MEMPGITLEEIIDNMNFSSMEKLLGESIIGTLKKLSDNKINIDECKKIAKILYGNNNPHSIREDKIRIQFIDALPLNKAQELSNSLGLKKSKNIYRDLKRLNLEKNVDIQNILLNFFGIVEETAAKKVYQPAANQIIPQYSLFKHQRKTALKTLAVLKEPPYKAVLHMPTGSGKTRTAMHIVARHMQEFGPTLVCWLANSAELLEQAADDFEHSWSVLGDRPINIYRFWGDKNLNLKDVKDGFLVAGFAKMNAASLKNQNILMILGDRATLTVVDEAHQAIAPTYRSVIEGIYTKKPQNILLGLTATPGRTWADIEEDEELSKFFGDNKIKISVDGHSDPITFLIHEGYLAKPTFKQINCETNFNFIEKEKQDIDASGEFPKLFMDRLAKDQDRNYQIILTIEELITRHKRIIVFGATVEHATILAGLLCVRGHEAKIVTGETPTTQRDRIINRFKSDNSKPQVLCNYGVLTTGFDAPKTSAAVIARPTKSLVLFSQMVGRAIRGPKAGGNKSAEIYTIIDTSLPGFRSIEEAFHNWEDVWNDNA